MGDRVAVPSSTPPDPDSVPPVGLAPEGQDFSHPWLVSAIVSAVCFLAGFLILKLTGLWGRIWEWADAPFMFYFAILLPVLVGFTCYGIALCVSRLAGKKKPAPRADGDNAGT